MVTRAGTGSTRQIRRRNSLREQLVQAITEARQVQDSPILHVYRKAVERACQRLTWFQEVDSDPVLAAEVAGLQSQLFWRSMRRLAWRIAIVICLVATIVGLVFGLRR